MTSPPPLNRTTASTSPSLPMPLVLPLTWKGLTKVPPCTSRSPPPSMASHHLPLEYSGTLVVNLTPALLYIQLLNVHPISILLYAGPLFPKNRLLHRPLHRRHAHPVLLVHPLPAVVVRSKPFRRPQRVQLLLTKPGFRHRRRRGPSRWSCPVSAISVRRRRYAQGRSR